MIRRLAIAVVVLGAIWAAPAQAAIWCGTPTTTDRTPELFGGSSVHVVYAVPSDGNDRLAQLASPIETDIESIDTWWRGQDPTRTPRFDLFQFPCGPQADLMSHRLAVPGAQLNTTAVIFNTIANELFQVGVMGPNNVALVYYDGPVLDPNLCGYGGWYTNGAGLGVVFVGACLDTHSDWAAAHEMTHAFGAVPDGAPHECPDSSHTCDNTSDLMYPYTFGDPLSSSILDPGRDDYYGHSGSWPDIQDSQYLRHLDSQVRLSLTITGAGTVTSDVQGVNCAVSCATDWDGGSKVNLTANPGNGLRFLRWSGACSGEDDCAVTLAADTAITAVFVPATFRLTASVAGHGTIHSSPAGIACKPHCKAAFTSFEPVRLTAKPAQGWKLRSWAGACHGKKLACSVPMKAAAGARAVFVKKPKPKA